MKGEIAVRYTIRHFDLPLLTFEANMDSADTGLHFIKVYEENRSFLPLNLTVSEDGVERWLRHRAIPKNRAYVDALLSKVGLSLNRPLGIIAANKGLSLNDCFWVDAEGSGDTFEKVNLYDNRFSQVLAAIAFTGYGSSIRTSLASCPEFSTNGMLPKCWRRQNGKIYLYKGGTSGFSNLGFEPYSELYAYQVAQVIGVNAIRYTLTKDLKKTLCSKCELFTSKEYSYIPIGQLVPKGGIKAIFAYYQTLGQNFVDALEDMLVFDAIICNTDRHYGNFGVLVDNKTNTIAAPAPLFDHGNSLFSLGGTDLWDNQKAFDEYARTLLPLAYDDFFAAAKSAMYFERWNSISESSAFSSLSALNLIAFSLTLCTRLSLGSRISSSQERVTCRYPNPSICTFFPSLRHCATSYFSSSKVAVTSDGLNEQRS